MKNDIRKVALITGASAGIGEKLAELHASKGGDLVLVARRENKLLSMKADLEKRFNIRVDIIAQDLSEKTSPVGIYDDYLYFCRIIAFNKYLFLAHGNSPNKAGISRKSNED